MSCVGRPPATRGSVGQARDPVRLGAPACRGRTGPCRRSCTTSRSGPRAATIPWSACRWPERELVLRDVGVAVAVAARGQRQRRGRRRCSAVPPAVAPNIDSAGLPARRPCRRLVRGVGEVTQRRVVVRRARQVRVRQLAQHLAREVGHRDRRAGGYTSPVSGLRRRRAGCPGAASAWESSRTRRCSASGGSPRSRRRRTPCSGRAGRRSRRRTDRAWLGFLPWRA
jgi:hypothetical protein